MTLFGTTLDGAQIAQLAFLLAVLVMWGFAFRDARHYQRWFRGRAGERKTPPAKSDDPPSRPPTGPWG